MAAQVSHIIVNWSYTLFPGADQIDQIRAAALPVVQTAEARFHL